MSNINSFARILINSWFIFSWNYCFKILVKHFVKSNGILSEETYYSKFYHECFAI